MISLPVPKGLIFRDNDEKKRLEGQNGIRQALYVFDCVDKWSSDTRLTPETLCELQRLAVNQIYRCAGHFRDGPVRIGNVVHQPPDHGLVAPLIDQMCDYIDRSWNNLLPVDIASYVMWRINWIHPFFGGNGRTARAASYLVLCAKLGFLPPGKETIQELIAENREPYYRALQSADAAWERGILDISDMRQVIADALAEQLVRVFSQATGIQHQIGG